MSSLFEALLRPAGPGDPDLEAAVDWLLGELRANGQIWGSPLRGWAGADLLAVVEAPDRAALGPEHHDPAVAEARAAVEARLVAPLAWTVRTEGPAPPPPGAVRSFLVAADAFESRSPVRSGADGSPLSLCGLVAEPHLRRELVAWLAAARDLRRIWLRGGPLEAAAGAELAAFDGALNLAGRALAAELERALGRPCYYALHAPPAPPSGAAARRCPGCGGRWARVPIAGDRGLDGFDCRCDACRLVSPHGSAD